MWSQYNFVYLLSSFLWCSSGTLAACYPLSIKNQQQTIKNTLTLFLNTKWMIKCNFSWIWKKGRKHLLISVLKNAFVTVEMVCNFYTCIQSDEGHRSECTGPQIHLCQPNTWICLSLGSDICYMIPEGHHIASLHPRAQSSVPSLCRP